MPYLRERALINRRVSAADPIAGRRLLPSSLLCPLDLISALANPAYGRARSASDKTGRAKEPDRLNSIIDFLSRHRR